MQIVLEEISKDFEEKFVAFSYEDICKDIFTNLCKNGSVNFSPSRIGSYWLNDFDGDTEIDVIAVDHQNKKLFAGECKYHNKPIDSGVFYTLREKIINSGELNKAFPGYDVIYGIFSKSGFTSKMTEAAQTHSDLILINETSIVG